MAIKERFGLQSAFDYLVAEKLMNFADASREHPEFARELPGFVAEVRRIFAIMNFGSIWRGWSVSKPSTLLPAPKPPAMMNRTTPSPAPRYSAWTGTGLCGQL